MVANGIRSICWDITSRCNDCCAFCYRNTDRPEMDLESNELILKKLIDFGVSKISFVGGEPLMYEGILELLRWGRRYAKGRTVFSLTTNARLLTEMKDGSIKVREKQLTELMEQLDWITFSLDAPDRESQAQMGRNIYHFDRVIAMLEYMKEREFQKKIKINSVMTRVNIDRIQELYDILNFYCVNRWKIFRFLPSRGSALKNRDRFYISKDEFWRKIEQILEYAGNGTIKITVNGYEAFEGSYITISSDGKMIVYDGQQYGCCVDLLTENAEKLLNYVDIDAQKKDRSDFLNS